MRTNFGPWVTVAEISLKGSAGNLLIDQEVLTHTTHRYQQIEKKSANQVQTKQYGLSTCRK